MAALSDLPGGGADAPAVRPAGPSGRSDEEKTNRALGAIRTAITLVGFQQDRTAPSAICQAARRLAETIEPAVQAALGPTGAEWFALAVAHLQHERVKTENASRRARYRTQAGKKTKKERP